MIAYACSDLIWATRIKGAAESVSVEARPARSVEALDRLLAEGAVAGLVVDLDQPETAMALIRRAREADGEACGTIRVLAFGPHVAKDLFRQAEDAGADEVLPRGALDRDLPGILQRLDS